MKPGALLSVDGLACVIGMELTIQNRSLAGLTSFTTCMFHGNILRGGV